LADVINFCGVRADQFLKICLSFHLGFKDSAEGSIGCSDKSFNFFLKRQVSPDWVIASDAEILISSNFGGS
jgi:hypothetical protein